MVAQEMDAMTRDEAVAFAVRWIDRWNSRDIEAVLAGFAENVEFTSPRALATVGVATVRGKQALRSYWETALAHVGSLEFVLQRILWDPTSAELAIIYTSTINGQTKQVSENLRFGGQREVVAAGVFHGAPRSGGA